MIPIISSAISMLATTVYVVGIAGAAGSGYGLGRKYGRKICEFADSFDDRITSIAERSSK